MKGISLFLCEQVVVRANGTFDVLNPWVTSFQVAPPLEPKICLFSHVAFEESDMGDHVAKLLLIDPDKKETLLQHASVVVGQERFDWRFSFLVNVKIEKTGLYKFVLKIDKKKAIECPLWILPQKGSNKGTVGFQTTSPATPPAAVS